MAVATLCALGTVLQIICIQDSLAIPANSDNVNSNQNNPLLSLVLQALANNNGQCNIVPANNNNQQVVNSNSQQNAGDAVAKLALGQSANQASLLSGPAAQTNPNQSILSQNTNNALVREVLSKSCACNSPSGQASNLISTPGSVPLSSGNFPISVVNKGSASPIPQSVSIPITISARDLSTLLNQNGPMKTIQVQPKLAAPAQSSCSIQNQPVLLNSQNAFANALSNPSNSMNSQSVISLPQDQPHQVQAQPSFSIVLSPQNPIPPHQIPTPSPCYSPASSPQYPIQGSKNSGLKMLLPLLFDLLNDKDCGCQRNCNCGCCNHSFMPPQVNNGYVNQVNHGHRDEQFTSDTEENEVVISATPGQKKSKGNDTNEDFDDDVSSFEVYDNDD